MAKYMKVEGNTSLVRDKASGAILNINNSEASQARLRKQQRMLAKEKHNELRDEVDEIKRDVNEIKDLLNKILEATNGSNNS
jgi:wobble nucleotide-excising tRNase